MQNDINHANPVGADSFHSYHISHLTVKTSGGRQIKSKCDDHRGFRSPSARSTWDRSKRANLEPYTSHESDNS